MITCILCRHPKGDKLQLGQLITKKKISVHTNCLYLSSNLVQRGNERNGILSFTIADIKAESLRCNKLICVYCSKRGANIGCCKSACRRTFHTVCGIQNDVQNIFNGTFQSFCHLHITEQSERPNKTASCSICFERLLTDGHFSGTRHILGKCCNNGWYHKDCLQHYANSAGYFFKCPLCNDSTKFRSIAQWGIFIPECDASWENDNAYDDQLVVARDCTAAKCLSPKGREAPVFDFYYCVLCGTNPMHPQCTNYTIHEYCCNDCSVVVQKDDSVKDTSADLSDPLDRLSVLLAASEQAPSSRQEFENVPDSKCLAEKNLSFDSSSNSELDDFDFIYRRHQNEISDSQRYHNANPSNARNIMNQPLRPISLLRIANVPASPLVGDRDEPKNTQNQSSGAEATPKPKPVKESSNLGLRIQPISSPSTAAQQKNIQEQTLNIVRPLRRTRTSPRFTPLISRSRPRERRSYLPNHRDVSCVANRTRARSNK